MSPVELDPINPWFSTVYCFLKKKTQPKNNNQNKTKELTQSFTEKYTLLH